MVQQYKAFWSIPDAGPSVSTFHAQASSELSAQSFADNVRQLLAASRVYMPDDVSITFDSEVTTINTATGQLESTQTVTAPLVVAGEAAGTWAAGSGARIVWGTSTIRNGRRVRGATFLVPLAATAFNLTGRVDGGVVTNLTNVAEQYIADGILNTCEALVYSRPIPGIPGAISQVTAANVDPMPATLRSRKS